MHKVRSIQFLVACTLVVFAFVAYQSFYGDAHNRAHASLSEGDQVNSYANYDPAHKRKIRSSLKENADALLSLKGRDVMHLFDAPELVRRDLPTTVWQYRNDSCVMDVYFTVGRDDDVARATVAHYEIRARDLRSDKVVGANDCVEDLVKRNTRLSLIDVQSVYKVSAR